MDRSKTTKKSENKANKELENKDKDHHLDLKNKVEQLKTEVAQVEKKLEGLERKFEDEYQYIDKIATQTGEMVEKIVGQKEPGGATPNYDEELRTKIEENGIDIDTRLKNLRKLEEEIEGVEDTLAAKAKETSEAMMELEAFESNAGDDHSN